jgi:hypothetical protein
MQSDLDFCRVSKELASKPTDRKNVILFLAVAQTGWPSNLRWPSESENVAQFACLQTVETAQDRHEPYEIIEKFRRLENKWLCSSQIQVI